MAWLARPKNKKLSWSTGVTPTSLVPHPEETEGEDDVDVAHEDSDCDSLSALVSGEGNKSQGSVVYGKNEFAQAVLAIPIVQGIYKRLGSGEFTQVYHCKVHGHGDAAVKVFRKGVSQRDCLQNLIVKSRHPNLMAMLEAVGSDQLSCAALILELCGPTVNWFLHDEPTETHSRYPSNADFGMRLQMALDVTRGLAHLHSHDIMHRSISSANCFLPVVPPESAASGPLEALPVKLGDCISAKEVEEGSSMTRWVGSVHYMSPEMMDTDGDEGLTYGPPSDIYSCGGILLNEFATGERPWCRVRFPLVCVFVAQGERPGSEAIPTTVSAAARSKLVDLIDRSWGHEPHARPSVGQLVEELSEVIGLVAPPSRQ